MPPKRAALALCPGTAPRASTRRLFAELVHVAHDEDQQDDAGQAVTQIILHEAREAHPLALVDLGHEVVPAPAAPPAAEKQKEQLLADAQRQADAIIADGKAAAEAERASKLRQADAQIADLTRTVCAKVLERNLTQQDDERLLADLLQKAGDGDGKRS